MEKILCPETKEPNDAQKKMRVLIRFDRRVSNCEDYDAEAGENEFVSGVLQDR
jgi:hypothetical protein